MHTKILVDCDHRSYSDSTRGQALRRSAFMAAQNMSTCLVIRAPNQKFGDQQVYCSLDWSVQQLKQHLSNVYPNKPRPEDQKLIYSGQLLENEIALKDVFRMDLGKTHILHLVCRTAGDSSDDSHSPISHMATSEPDFEMADDSTSNVPSTSSVTSASSAINNDELRHRSTSSGGVPLPNGQMPFAVGMPAGALSPEQLMQQLAFAQQLYAHYFTQYMQLMHQAAPPPVVQASAPAPASPQAAAPAAPAAPAAAAPPPAPRVAPENRGPRMNAQGGPLLDEEEEEAAQRDWLDWIYTVSRATVLLSIVYFYSSFGRFLVVTGIALLMYLYQGGWFAALWQQQELEQGHDQNREREADQQQADHPAAEIHPQGQAGPEQFEEAMDHDGNDAPPEPGVSPLTTAWTFVATFFTSLIPEQPPPVNAN
ncbi:homocysteine-induced endoplasmic reticulum protein isoform X5 [Rhipicephalus microplus]|uniref:homocysteine-induced endoplasmic reticulum protein isoform X5 n=1 Tax=Rhipicephalus microplus TaxID=6941 RepID=UPI002F2B0E8E